MSVSEGRVVLASDTFRAKASGDRELRKSNSP